MAEASALPNVEPPALWAKVVDHTRCIGCHACSVACKAEHEVPLGVFRTYVKYAEVGRFPATRRAFQVTRCNQCTHPPCVPVCPTAAMFRRPDGIVDFDKSACIGCRACMAACPYDAIFLNPADHAAEKCNLCAHRLEVGLEPSCVVVCPTEAILVGDLGDGSSRVSALVASGAATVRRPEKGTRPRLFYVGAHDATLDPLAARRPEGDLFLWSQQHEGRAAVPDAWNPTIAADVTLAYDVPRQVPWGWRVSLSTWTKSVAAGAYLVALLLVALGGLPAEGALWQWLAPALALVFVAITGVLLVTDLARPTRAHLILTRAQAGSWLVRGAAILCAYSVVLAAHLGAAWTASPALQTVAMAPGFVLAILTAVYTAYLMAQARGRDLWQSPLLPVQFVIQACVAGAAVLSVLGPWLNADASRSVGYVAGAANVAHLLAVLAGLSIPAPTAHAREAARAMTHGRYARPFWASVALAAVGALTPWLGAPAAIAALVGLWAHGHAHLRAGQAVPLA